MNGNGLENAIVTVGGVAVNLETTTTTDLSFKYPYLTAGSHSIEIRVGSALAFPVILTTTPLDIRYLERSWGSPEGHRVKIKNYGFPTDISEVETTWKCENRVLPLTSSAPGGAIIEIPPKTIYDTCILHIETGGKTK